MATMLSWGDEAMEEEGKLTGKGLRDVPEEWTGGKRRFGICGRQSNLCSKSDPMNLDVTKNGYQRQGTHSAEDNISSAANEHVEHDQRSKPTYGSDNDTRRRGGHRYDQSNTHAMAMAKADVRMIRIGLAVMVEEAIRTMRIKLPGTVHMAYAARL